MKIQIFAIASFALLTFISSCDNTIFDSSIDMESFFVESCELTKVPTDSINRFATKVCTYVVNHPEAENDPLYPDIQENIRGAAKKAGITLTITINTEWDGETVIYF